MKISSDNDKVYKKNMRYKKFTGVKEVSDLAAKCADMIKETNKNLPTLSGAGSFLPMRAFLILEVQRDYTIQQA